MNVKELKEIVDTNSNDKVNKVFERLYGIIANRAKDGYTSYTTTRQKLGLTESEFLAVTARLSKDGYSVYVSKSSVKFEDVEGHDDLGLGCLCAWIATGILKLQGVRITRIEIVWKFEED